jgi:hypothetical protein
MTTDPHYETLISHRCASFLHELRISEECPIFLHCELDGGMKIGAHRFFVAGPTFGFLDPVGGRQVHL